MVFVAVSTTAASAEKLKIGVPAALEETCGVDCGSWRAIKAITSGVYAGASRYVWHMSELLALFNARKDGLAATRPISATKR